MSTINFPSEKFIEDYVCETLSNDGCCPITNDYIDAFYRQEGVDRYGIPDVIKIIIEGGAIRVHILELKNVTLKPDHVAQLCRYMTGAKAIADRYSRMLNQCPPIHVFGELAGLFDKNAGDLVFLLNELNKDISLYDISANMLEGFSSSSVGRGWRVTIGKPSAKGIARDLHERIKSGPNLSLVRA